MPNLADLLLEHYTILPAGVGGDAAAGHRFGKDYNFQLIYEHSAATAAKTNPAYRYVALPDRIDLSTPAYNADYAKATVTMPGVGTAASRTAVTIPAACVAWGVTIPNNSANRDQALAFLMLLLGPVGTAALAAEGPTPVEPPLVSTGDYALLPRPLQSLVAAGTSTP